MSQHYCKNKESTRVKSPTVFTMLLRSRFAIVIQMATVVMLVGCAEQALVSDPVIDTPSLDRAAEDSSQSDSGNVITVSDESNQTVTTQPTSTVPENEISIGAGPVVPTTDDQVKNPGVNTTPIATSTDPKTETAATGPTGPETTTPDPADPTSVDPDPTDPVPPVTPTPTAAKLYGNAVGASALGPHRLGGPLNTYRQSYRFEAPASDTVASFRWYNQYEGSQGSPKSGYYNQGSVVPVHIEIFADDGNGFPDMSGQTYGETDVANTLDTPTYAQVSFINLKPLMKGHTFHIVMTNTSPDPENNFSSTNHLWLLPEDVDGTNNQWALTDKQWALTYFDPSDGKWHDRDDYNDIVKSASWDRRTSRNTPIGEVCLAGGDCIGQGYVHGLGHSNASYGHLREVQGNNSVRQRFTPTKTIQVKDISLFGMRNGDPSGPLSISLTECDSTTLWTGMIAASAYPTPIMWHNGFGPSNFDWAKASMPVLTLQSGTDYCVDISAPAGDPYWIKSMEHGGSSLFTCAAKFCDGYSQYSSDGGSTWNNWTIWGSASTYADLSFFFEIVE